MAGIIEQDFTHWCKPTPLNDLYPDSYDLKCITSIEELNNILDSYKLENGKYPMMGFDTETTGLNPEENNIVGYSFSFDEIHGYYVPVNHKNIEEESTDEGGNPIIPKVFVSLGDEALDIIYDVMLNCELVLMFNARFDIRMMKWYKFSEMSDEFKHDFIFNARMNFKYDMSKVNVYDVQVLVWASDTAHYMPKLKWAELQFLGWRSTTFQETSGDAGNFGALDPEEPLVYKYAATDALALILLYNCDKLKAIRDEAGLSLQLHANIKLMPLTYFEETPILADVDLLKKQSEYYHNKLDETEKRIYNIVGYEFNIASGPSRAKAFKDKNIIIMEKTESGATATGAGVLEKIQKELDPESEQYILISLCIEYLHIKKMLSTYIDSLLDQVTKGSPEYKTGLFRYSYRNTATVSGRYSLAGVPSNFITDNNVDLSLYEKVNSKKETVAKYKEKLSHNKGLLLAIYKKKADKQFKRPYILATFACGHTCLIRSDSNYKCQQVDCHNKYFSESQKRAKNTPEWKEFCSNWSKEYYSKESNKKYHSIRTKEGMHQEDNWNKFLNIMSKRFKEPNKQFIKNYIKGRIKDQRNRANPDELLFINILENNNIAYNWQDDIYDEENNKIFIIDFYLPEYKLYVEIDGGSHNRKEKQHRDILLNEYCKLNRLSILHLTPEQLKDSKAVINIIRGKF